MFQGQATDIAIQAEQMAYTKRLLQERIAQHTGQTYETIEADRIVIAGSRPSRPRSTASSIM